MIYQCKYNILFKYYERSYPVDQPVAESMEWNGTYAVCRFNVSKSHELMYKNLYSIYRWYPIPEEQSCHKYIDVVVELNEGDVIDVIVYKSSGCIKNYTILKIDPDEITYIESDGDIRTSSPWHHVIMALQRKMRLHSIDDLVKMCE